jgi:hypothetical protein
VTPLVRAALEARSVGASALLEWTRGECERCGRVARYVDADGYVWCGRHIGQAHKWIAPEVEE